jgi:hypothetical protein
LFRSLLVVVVDVLGGAGWGQQRRSVEQAEPEGAVLELFQRKHQMQHMIQDCQTIPILELTVPVIVVPIEKK